MKKMTSTLLGWLTLVTGLVGSLCLITLLLFFIGLFQNISALSSLGSVNDGLNALAGILSAILATVLFAIMGRANTPTGTILVVGTWVGAIAIAYGSWLIVTGRSGVERSGYYYIFGNGLIGLWLWSLNRRALQEEILPPGLARWGRVTAGLMLFGLPALVGILQVWDGNMFSPLLLITGISYIGIAILYPIWCLRLGRWFFSNQKELIYE